MKHAMILDLDNTIYPVSSIASHLFKSLFELLDEYAHEMDSENLHKAKYELTRRPYQFVANQFNFSQAHKTRGITLLRDITYDLPVEPYDGYALLKTAPLKKFLVTTGFKKLQWSKIKMLNIENDFDEIHIVDPEVSPGTKKDVFEDIMKRHHYLPADVLVVGDDPESEIKAGVELGIETFLFDPDDKHPNAIVTFKGSHLKKVLHHII
jgi:putative hydrolase of the HAD superfamily